jgi:tetratricopeptide (TPR) repeat protein
MNPSHKRPILAALVLVLVAFGVSLPWQMKQWKALEEEREKTRLQEARIAELRANPSAGSGAPVAPTGGGSAAERLALLQTAAEKGDTANALAGLRQMETANLTPEERARLAGVYQTLDYVDRAYAEARRAVEDAKKAGQESPEALLRFGYLEMLLGYSQSALNLFQRAAALSPNDAPPQVAVALAHDRRENFPAAEAALRKAVSLAPDNTPARLLLVKNLATQGKYADALRELNPAEKQAPTLPDLPLQRAAIHLAEAEKSPERRGSLLSLAEKAVARCLTLDPNNTDARYQAGRIAQERGDGAGARREWEALYALRPDYPSLTYQLAQLYRQAGESAKAAPLLKEYTARKAVTDRYNDLVTASGQSPRDTQKRRELAKWCAENGRVSRAILEYERILEQTPDDADARRERDRLVAEREKTAARPGAPS